ncbi:hypothetical protein EXIGLDRAFT_573527, partial [Exidia glandulosa HHB12029]
SKSGLKLRLFKSDGSKAYRRAPAHPLWQIKQVVSVNNSRHVDRCCNFGTKSAGDIWFAIIALVLWAAQFVHGIEALLGYVDDVFSFDDFYKMVLYKPYNRLMAPKQAALLHLWDWVGIPHSDDKQVSGSPLVIIGFEVDPNLMTITMSEESRSDLISKIEHFVSDRDSHDDGKRKLVEWQRLLGHANWALNAYPLLRPGLASSYDKIRGKSGSSWPVVLNTRVVRDLLWFACTLRSSSGVQLLDANDWQPHDADLTLYCDASLTGLGYWCPAKKLGFAAVHADHNIIRNESLCVLSALQWAASQSPKPARIAIYTDSQVSVDLFDSLKADLPYNQILLSAVEIMLSQNVSARVYHISGTRNAVADALSRGRLDLAAQLSPGLVITSHLRSYVGFCRRHNLPYDPTPDTLSLYVAYESHFIDTRSVKSYLSGVCNALEPIFPGVRDARASPLVKNTIVGRLKMAQTAVTRKSPLSAEDVARMVTKYGNGSHNDILFACLLAIGFSGLHRLGELVWPDTKALQSSRKCITLASLTCAADHFEYDLPGHKGNRFFEG